MRLSIGKQYAAFHHHPLLLHAVNSQLYQKYLQIQAKYLLHMTLRRYFMWVSKTVVVAIAVSP